MKDTFINTVLAVVLCLLGLYSAAACFRGRLVNKINLPKRLLCALAAILLIAPDYITGAIGVVVFAVTYIWDKLGSKKEQAV